MDLGGSIPGLPGERGQQLDEEGHWQENADLEV